MKTRVKYETADRYEDIRLYITECIEAMFKIYTRSGQCRAASLTKSSSHTYDLFLSKIKELGIKDKQLSLLLHKQ